MTEASEPDAGITYPYLRSVLAPQYALLPAPQLQAIMRQQYGEGAAEQYDEYFEGFFGDVGKFFTKAAPVVANIAGGVVKGATSGASLGLPGIIGGAVAGGVGQGFASYGSGTLRDIGKGINTGIGLAGQFTGTGRIGSALGGALSDVGQGKNVLKSGLGAASSLAGGMLGGGAGGSAGALAGLVGGRGGASGALGSLAGLLGGASGGGGGGAASQLVGLLRNPAVMQSLGAMAMGPTGRTTVPVGSAQTPVPVSAFANLLGMLANRAADEQAALSDGSESDLRYLTDAVGEWVADPAESEQRAVHLYNLLATAELERLVVADLQQQRQELDQLQQQLSRQQQQQEIDRRQLLRQQASYQERARRTVARQQAQERESAMHDELALFEARRLNEAPEADFTEGAVDEYDEYDEYDELAQLSMLGESDEADEGAGYDDSAEYDELDELAEADELAMS